MDGKNNTPTFAQVKRWQAKYRRIFRENNPPGPWPCYFSNLTGCKHGGIVYDKPGLEGDSFIVHHVDGSGSFAEPNNDPSNLVPGHHGCHTCYHMTARWSDPAQRAKLSVAHEGKKHSTKTRAKLRAVNIGKTHSAEARAKMSASHKDRKPVSPETRAKLSEGKRRAHAEGRYERANQNRKMIGVRVSCLRCRREVSVLWLTRHKGFCKGQT